jgi:hypothetical protein
MLQRIRHGDMPPQAEAPENAGHDAAARTGAQS